MQHILLVEDNVAYQALVRAILGEDDRSIDCCLRSDEALKAMEQMQYDLVLLDISLSGKSGFDVISEHRRRPEGRATPIIFLTSKEGMTEKITAYSLGADDYITKSVDPLELKAKVDAKLRNLKHQDPGARIFRKCGLRIDLSAQKALTDVDGKETDLRLTPLEFKLLYFLARSDAQTFTREQILTGVWGIEVEVNDRTVDTHVSALRKKMGQQARLIESVPTLGYRFNAQTIKRA